MREAALVGLKAVVFVGLWLAFPASDGPPPDDGGGTGWLLLVLIALVALLWGVLDGLVAHGSLTRPMLRWAATAPVVAVLTALGGGIADGAWLEPVDLVRWTAGLTAMLYFTLVLPAGLGVVTGSALQGLARWGSRDLVGRR
jgi:hypothetical protein